MAHSSFSFQSFFIFIDLLCHYRRDPEQSLELCPAIGQFQLPGTEDRGQLLLCIAELCQQRA